MIRITDMTLSCITVFRPSAEQLRKLYALLCALGTDFIEMPAEVYETVRPPASDKIILRIGTPDEAAQYPELPRFVCRMNGLPSTPAITREVQMNDIKELAYFGRSEEHRHIRIVGLDDILCHDFEAAFAKIRSRVKGRVEFCPENGYSCATAAAVEWVTSGGTDLAASFGGLGGKAALEEVLLSLRVVRRHRPTASYSELPRIAALIEEMTQQRFSGRKPVIGRSIFCVESGIHVDGILKKPQMYEPFLPELVGSSRTFIMGKHSGKKSIAAKLGEFGYDAGNFDIPRILNTVREESIRKMSSLTDKEFEDIALRYRL